MTSDLDLELYPDGDSEADPFAPSNNDSNLTQENSPAHPLLDGDESSPVNADLDKLSKEMREKFEQLSNALEKTYGEILAQGIVVAEMHKQNQAHREKMNLILKRTNEIPKQMETLNDPLQSLQKLQAQLRPLVGRRRRAEQPAFHSIHPKIVVGILLFHALIVSLVVVAGLHFIPPGAAVKTQQQWLAIFQRVDRLYKDRFGEGQN